MITMILSLVLVVGGIVGLSAEIEAIKRRVSKLEGRSK